MTARVNPEWIARRFRPRAFVYGARGPATGGEWRWFPGIRWSGPDGRTVHTTVLGGYGADWDTAARRAALAVEAERRNITIITTAGAGIGADGRSDHD